MTTTKLGFIGLGLMGSPIALKLREKSHPLSIWGRDQKKLAPLVAAGAHQADSPAAVAADSDIVFLCVTNTAAVEQVVFAENGIASTASAEKILIDHSTIQATASKAMADKLQQQTGMRWLDAPISGGATGVAKKTLVVMAGGEQEVFERVKPVVMDYAGRFTLMGPSGAGQSTKLINQALVGAGFAILAEATKLAQNAGIDASKIPQALAGGRADSVLLQEFMPYMAEADFTPRGRIDIILKDLDLVSELAKATGTALPLTTLAAELHRIMVARGQGADDNAAYIQLLDQGN